MRFLRKALVLIGCCLVTASFVYLFYIVQLRILTEVWAGAYMEGQNSCDQGQYGPQGDKEEVYLAK